MSDSKVKPVPMLSVYSGQIIGAVVDALAIHHDVLDDRTARRFFAGQPVNQHSHTKILLAIGEVLVDRGIVPVPPLFRQRDVSMPIIVAATVARAAQRWDQLVSTMQSRSGRTTDSGKAVEGFLRIVVVDLAVRAFALMRLAGLKPSEPETPLWSQENGGGKLLRALTRGANLTRDQLAARLGVSATSVDNWLDGNNRPTPENISVIAKVLAGRTAGSRPEQLEQNIRRQFAFAHVADLVAHLIGREQVMDLSAALVRFIWLMTEDVNSMDRPPLEEAAGAEIDALRLGTAYLLSHNLLRNLAILEKDPGWKRDILAATVDWSVPFQWAGGQTLSPKSSAGLAQDIPVDSSDSDDAEVFSRLMSTIDNINYLSVLSGGPAAFFRILDDGIAQRRAIVRDFPNSARAHNELGSFLGMVGKHMGRRDLVDEGIIECHIASALLPTWDTPAVEPGIMLANIGAFDEAIRDLAQAAERLPSPTPHLQFATGYALMELSALDEALEQFEMVIKARPDYATAHLHAAHCAFMLTDKQKGVRYAKTARRLGEPGAFIAWREGKYPSPKRKRRARQRR